MTGAAAGEAVVPGVTDTGAGGGEGTATTGAGGGDGTDTTGAGGGVCCPAATGFTVAAGAPFTVGAVTAVFSRPRAEKSRFEPRNAHK